MKYCVLFCFSVLGIKIKMRSESTEEESLTDGRRATGAKVEIVEAGSVSDVFWSWIVWSMCRRGRRNKAMIREKEKGQI